MGFRNPLTTLPSSGITGLIGSDQIVDELVGKILTGGLIRTATAGTRMEMDSTAGNQLRFFAGSDFEQAAGSLVSSYADQHLLTLTPPRPAGSLPPSITLAGRLSPLFSDRTSSIAIDADSITLTAAGRIAIDADSMTITTTSGMSINEGGLVPTGGIIMFGSVTPPTGYLVCDGASLLRSTYAALFAVIGTTYGAVDGTHFTLPNLASAFPRGNTPASNGGAATHTLTSAEMPSHNHTQNSHNHTQNAHDHQDTIYYAGVSSLYARISSQSTSGTGNLNRPYSGPGATATNQAATATNQSTGGGGAHNNLPPYIGVSFIIKT